jgi:PD-(D/E)XK nuclease superfamily
MLDGTLETLLAGNMNTPVGLMATPDGVLETTAPEDVNRADTQHLLREQHTFISKMSRVIIKASDVAAILGQNKFKSREEVFNDLWKKYSPENFNSKTKLDLVEDALKKSTSAQRVVEAAASIKTDDTQNTIKEAEQKIKQDTTLSEDDKAKVIDHIRSKVNTNFGTRKEDETADLSGLDLRRDDTFHKLYIGTYNDRDYEVVGRIDRVEILPDGSKILIEIKNRTKNFFYKVYPSEMIQVQVYLEMIDFHKAKLIEQFGSKINILHIQRDKKMFEKEILPGLEQFCFELSQAML